MLVKKPLNKKINNVFMILATKPLNDGTKGFRFNVMGNKGVYRKRSRKSRGWFKITHGEMKGYHMGKRSLYIHKPQAPKMGHFAG